MTYRRIRKLIHLTCAAAFVTLPFFDLMRLDIPRARFFVAGQELWISEFGIVFLSLMSLMFLVAAVSMIYGRLYCSYACPQMIFSEASIAVEAWARRLVNRRLTAWPRGRRKAAARFLVLAMLATASVFLAFVFVAYFVAPRDLLQRLVSFDITTAAGMAGAVTTLITFVDFAFVRQRFCTTVCPYGYLQGMLADSRTLLVEYRDPAHECIECRKCVRVCEMGIDIRDSAHQIECIHCGDCIDACIDVMGRLGRDTLVHYTWGERGRTFGAAGIEPWPYRLGLRDAKRAAVLGVVLLYAIGLGVALALRHPVMVRVAPERSATTELYTTDAEGRIVNRFRMSLANRSGKPAEVVFEAEGLRGARLSRGQRPITLMPGETLQGTFDLSVPPADLAGGVKPFRLVSRTMPDGTVDAFDMTFIGPEAGRTP
ncbi:MAG: 4Fe-4S dicluster domain-containing protein [Acidobacteriota bacterium]